MEVQNYPRTNLIIICVLVKTCEQVDPTKHNISLLWKLNARQGITLFDVFIRISLITKMECSTFIAVFKLEYQFRRACRKISIRMFHFAQSSLC